MGEADPAATTTPVKVKPPSRVHLSWNGHHRFDGARQSGGPSIRLDGSGVTGPSPVDALLCAMAACTGIDVVDILDKRRTPVESFGIDVVGDRFNGVPARITAIEIQYTITGNGIERVHAERAIELAITKYCSVRDSLDPNMPITWTLTLNGATA